MIRYVSRFFLLLTLILIPLTQASNSSFGTEVLVERYVIPSFEDQMRTQEFSLENLSKALDYYGIEYPEVVVAQAILETGRFTSPIYREQNNLFGMKHPSVRETTSLGGARGHAKYEHWLDSVIDYKLWQEYRTPIHKDYFEFLTKRSYAEDRYYTRKLRSIVRDTSV